MPIVRYALAAAAAACLIGGVAVADPASTAPPDTPAGPSATDQSTAPPATSSDQTGSGQMNSADPTNGSGASAGAPSDQSTQMAAPTGAATNASADVGGAQVIASQPVPDTPDNRAKYGAPMSHAGKHTAASGN